MTDRVVARRRAPVNANPELLALPLVLPEQRRTRDPLPEALVQQLLRRGLRMDLHLTDRGARSAAIAEGLRMDLHLTDEQVAGQCGSRQIDFVVTGAKL
jgi:hypothetical protein